MERLREIEQAATPGRWTQYGRNAVGIRTGGGNLALTYGDNRQADAEFIATARNTYAALLDVASFIDDFLFGCEDPDGNLTDANLAELRDRAMAHAERLREVSP